jgi:hypothetical protein
MAAIARQITATAHWMAATARQITATAHKTVAVKTMLIDAHVQQTLK